MRKRGFTLIELLAVIVILAIIALIAVPIIINIVSESGIESKKISIDNYGDAVKQAVVKYQLVYKEKPKSFNQLNIEYNGSRVDCKIKDINYDDTIYLSNCSVNGEEINNYEYGKSKRYKVGDTVIYNNIDFYVISNSEGNQNYLVLLKTKALTQKELENLGFSSSNGRVAFYTSDDCNTSNRSHCFSNYETSNVKRIVDAWTENNFNSDALIKDNDGYVSRLITIEELRNNLGYGQGNSLNDNVPDFVYINSHYWTMSTVNNNFSAWLVGGNNSSWPPGILKTANLNNLSSNAIRPVVNLRKSVIR